jgi:NADP-dependent 3-hydroxy acid dehydrogenase YdfG
MYTLNDKVAVVTGGGSGMGLAIAQMLLAEGARVAITGRDADKLASAASTLNAGPRLLTVAGDVGDPDQVTRLFAQVVAGLGPVQLLVNNAGTNLKERTMRQLTPARWQQLVRTNLDGAFYCIHAVLPSMLERKDGVVININSVSGKRANPLAGAAYAASKFGMAALGLCLAAEERESGVRVCNIYPGEVDTPILAVRPTPVTAEQRAKILQPADVAAAVKFVATLPPHVSVPELVIKPTAHLFI